MMASQTRGKGRLRRRALAAAFVAVLVAPTAQAFETGTDRRDRNAETFDWVLQRIDETYWDPAFAEEWRQLGEELRARALEAGDDAELRAVLTELLAGLGQSHFQIIAATPTRDAESRQLSGEHSGPCDGELRRQLLVEMEEGAGPAEPGFDLRLIDEEAIVVSVTAGSAAEAGLESGWRLEAVDGLDVTTVVACLAEGFGEGSATDWAVHRALMALLSGPEASLVSLVLVDRADRRHQVELVRQESPGVRVEFGNLPPMPFRFESGELETPEGRAVGLVRFNVWLFPLAEAFESAYRGLADSDGLILDLRGNPGGIGGLVMGIGGYLLPEPVSLGTLRSRRDVLEFRVNPRRVSTAGEPIPIFDGPVALLVDGMTASTSEIFAAGLQDVARARVFGETTMGAALPALLERMPNGDLLMHAIADFLRPGGGRIEGHGVVPDEEVALTREALAVDSDPSLEAALRWIDRAEAEDDSGSSE